MIQLAWVAGFLVLSRVFVVLRARPPHNAVIDGAALVCSRICLLTAVFIGLVSLVVWSICLCSDVRAKVRR